MLDVATEAPPAPADGGAARRGPRRLRIALAVAAVLLLGSWFALSRSTEPHDPRAYPGSQSQDLPGTLERYHLRLPECAQPSARYHRHAQWEADSFYLHLTADGSCVDLFLLLNGLYGDAGERAGLPFDPRTVAGFGWPQDPTLPYRTFGNVMARATLVEVEAAVHRSGDRAELYLLAELI
ncbi:hypothetical protein ACFQY4_16350 [Catellatospora bangladeshensis]|uniref:Uncharacterized protein n=1 Tax=Catellatospora bangladeshensis TaxID=310355 RepID=A0A8J3JRK2_9ACTN|nr:hypothetical protein [Catellatospora bangladeshensis]GIF85651.1 hypothetical protein Cba03nite_70000 [Catellatospora bangladeshensis]